MHKGGGAVDQARSMELLWGMAERPTRGPKPNLSLERIVQAAIALADAEGIGAVSMQRVAAEFGFTTMSLYRYVPGKTELLDLMIDTTVGPPPDLAAIPGGWRPKLAEWARTTYAGFQAHPWFLGVALGRLMGPNQVGWLERAVAAMADTPLRGQEQIDAVLTVNGYVRSLAPFAQPATPLQDGLSVEDFSAGMVHLMRTNADRFPALNQAIADGAFGTDDNDIEFGLQRILDGIEAYIARSSTLDG
jgi:AcrR family transcriptional regulator